MVIAIAEQPGPPAIRTGRGWHLEATSQPVGVQHAAATVLGVAPPLVALCGADIEGWVLFGATRFAPGGTASCQRCAQLASPGPPRPQIAPGSAVPAAALEASWATRDPEAIGGNVRALTLSTRFAHAVSRDRSRETALCGADVAAAPVGGTWPPESGRCCNACWQVMAFTN
jgi:hypothetical protein